MSVNEHRPKPADLKFEILEGATTTSATFVFGDEDHTLGNALRHVLMQMPETDFCGYSVPHPSEPKMNLRLQTRDGVPAIDVLKRGLQDLVTICDILDEKLDAMGEPSDPAAPVDSDSMEV
ncbi:RNA polymerase Rpb3/Rpb11 dimerization domain-containing protein [Tribonema minus]|uniref:DNA-directed RNA polymerases I and III subunit RPAC2 n=1 Tax=Tribonema minus TaxID=303371 RepID=A0A835YNA2_9STRA|nr:RNA polymerase Rpb3/Rpb11 dimerization domain-containing protein [Tribonema minus]